MLRYFSDNRGPLNWIIALAIFVISVTRVSAYPIQVNFDRTARFSQYNTYVLVGSADAQSSKIFPMGFCERLSGLIQEHLAAKHLRSVATGGDLTISYNITLRKYSQNINLSDGVGPTGLGSGDAVYSETVHRAYEWTLVINIIDTKEKNLVFRGQLSQATSSTGEKNAKKLAKAVDEILAKYPPEPFPSR